MAYGDKELLGKQFNMVCRHVVYITGALPRPTSGQVASTTVIGWHWMPLKEAERA